MFLMKPGNSAGPCLFKRNENVSGENFSTFIGNATPAGVPPTIFLSSVEVCLAFALDATPDTEIGSRTPITSSGYAHSSLVAQSPIIMRGRITRDCASFVACLARLAELSWGRVSRCHIPAGDQYTV